MMQTEKSHIPYPDEPPVHFPPAAVWRELTALRREAYLNSNLGEQPAAAQIELKSKIENDEVLIAGEHQRDPAVRTAPATLEEAQHDVHHHGGVLQGRGRAGHQDQEPNLTATQLRGLKLGTFLDIVLLSMNATYIVRPDYIEITTFDAGWRRR